MNKYITTIFHPALVILFLFTGCSQDVSGSGKSGNAPSKAASNVSKNEINWYSVEEGLLLGKKEARKVFLHFYADWCGFCEKFDKTTFKESSVIAYLNENFIPVKVDTDKYRKLMREYQVRGLPSTWFLSEDGERISSLPGYIEPDRLMNTMKYIATDNYRKMSFTAFVESL